MSANTDTKEFLRQQYAAAKSITFGRMSSPLEEEMKDPERIQKIFAFLPVIPFFDNSDSTLKVLRTLATLSPSHGSCINNMQNYVAGGGLRAGTKVRPGASFARSAPLSLAQEEDVWSFLEASNSATDLLYFIEQVRRTYLNLAVYGNAGLIVRYSKVGGQYVFYYESVDAEKFRYLAIPGGKSVAISASWEADYLLRYYPEILSVYPSFSKGEDGVYSTFIHTFYPAVGRDWYGLPKSYQSIYYQYIEYQLGDYATKGYANAWTGQVFFETAGDNTDDIDIALFREGLKNTFSTAGKSQRIVHRHRAESDPETFVHEFKDDKSHEFHSGMADIAEKQIIKSHDWSHILMSVPTPGRLGNSQEFREIYETKLNGVIIPWQDKVMTPFNQMYRLMERLAGAPPASLTLQNLLEFQNEDDNPSGNE